MRRAMLLSPLALLFLLWLATWPPMMPAPEAVRAAWRPTESWLYDRQGRLLESRRVDFSQRRLGWTTNDGIAPALRQMVIAAEDRRFASHGGVDWLATAGSVRD
ncbi:MAG: transglycosylase domain-containing protein, partial [Rhizorhabdus sp.]